MNWGVFAQDYTPRLDLGARLEPRGGLMHGAGQSTDAFAAYWNTLPAGRRPMVYMHYISLRNLPPTWADELKTTLLGYPDAYMIPQVGLEMTASGSGHYEQQVASGDYDQQIDSLIEGLRRLALPVYLRIGYEFNGLTWNGYQPVTYKQAFIRITGKLRAANLEVATVWDAAIDGVKNYFDYYPGDEYVDWFGMNIFRTPSFKDPSLTGFFNEARMRRKPVMIGETTPYQVGAQGGAASWYGWFTDFFDSLRNNAVVKQFNYINWDWVYWSRQANQS
jgi:beta-mannanase